jgi:shikimate kinase
VSPILVLLGPPGSGTSTVAGLLAARLGVALRDSDRDVEQALGAPVAEIFLEQGEAAFRDAERVAVLDALQNHAGLLVVGGGAVMDPLVEQPLKEAAAAEGDPPRVVFLDVTIADAARRIGLNSDRPAALGSPRAQWLRMMEHRRPVYAALADLTVSTDDRTAEQVAEQILGRLGGGR